MSAGSPGNHLAFVLLPDGWADGFCLLHFVFFPPNSSHLHYGGKWTIKWATETRRRTPINTPQGMIKISSIAVLLLRSEDRKISFIQECLFQITWILMSRVHLAEDMYAWVSSVFIWAIYAPSSSTSEFHSCPLEGGKPKMLGRKADFIHRYLY